MIKPYSKIHQLGHRDVLGIFCEPVLIEEKVDGSQWSFSVDGDFNLTCRSRGQMQSWERHDKMFDAAFESIGTIQHKLVPGWTYRGEYLSKPKHNTLKYDRVPKLNIVIFDIDRGDQDYLTYTEKEVECDRIGLEVVPIIFGGTLTKQDQLLNLLERESFLGGTKIEGLVIKQYNQLDSSDKVCMAKYVSEAFKEVHVKDWRNRNPGSSDILQNLTTMYRTQARWEKALQHCREAGLLTDEPKDIAALVKEVQGDILEECKEEITEILFKWAWKTLCKRVVGGLPEWYKGLLCAKHFEGESNAIHITGKKGEAEHQDS